MFIILQIFFSTCPVSKILAFSFSWGIFGHVACLDQIMHEQKYLMINYNNIVNILITECSYHKSIFYW